MRDEQDLLAVEDEYIAAEVNRDEAVPRRPLDEHFVHNHGNGKTGGKEDLIGAIMNGNMSGQTLRERCALVDGALRIAFGTADIRFRQADESETLAALRYTATCVRRGGHWGMLALQMQARVD